jgi:hypothetical protein
LDFRFDNIVKEFKQYGLSDLDIVGASKNSNIINNWNMVSSISIYTGTLMAFNDMCTVFSFQSKNPWQAPTFYYF